MTVGNRECDEDGCWASAEADGPLFQVGKPPGDITLMRRMRCGAGHWYYLDAFYNPDIAWADDDQVSEVSNE